MRRWPRRYVHARGAVEPTQREGHDIHDRPVLTGALHTALTSARDEVFDTVRQHTIDPGTVRPVPRRSP